MTVSGSFYLPTVLSRLTGSTGEPMSVAGMLKSSREWDTRNTYKPTQSGTINLQNALNNRDAVASRQRIMLGAIQFINDVAQERRTPTEDWEMTGGYMATKGLPFHVEVNQSGQINVLPQEDMISELPINQQPKMRAALDRLEELKAMFDEETTKDLLHTKLEYAVFRIDEMNLFKPAQEPWEEEFLLRRDLGRPMIVGLDKDGDLQTFDQIETNFEYVEDDDDRLKLQLAGMRMESIIAGDVAAVESWETLALGKRLSGDDYFLDVDEDGEIVVRENNDKISGANSILPSYLQEDVEDEYYIVPEYLRGGGSYDFYEQSWEEKAMEMYKNKTPFHLDVSGSSVRVIETDFNATRTRDLLSNNHSSRLLNARVNLLI